MSTADRTALQSEVEALETEIDRIKDDTTWAVRVCLMRPKMVALDNLSFMLVLMRVIPQGTQLLCADRYRYWFGFN